MAWPIVPASAGVPVTDVSLGNGLGTPIEEATNGFGVSVTFVATRGIPVVWAPALPPGAPAQARLLFGADGAPLKGADGAYLFGVS